MRNKRLVALALVASMLLTGCSKAGENTSRVKKDNKENENKTGTVYEEGSIVTLGSIMEKYGVVETNAVEPMYNMAEDEKFTFNFKFDFAKYSVSVNELVTVHTDSRCLEESMLYTSNTYEETENGGSLLTVSPLSCPLKNNENRADSVEGNFTWGNAPMYYIAIWYDMEADELVKLDTPTIIPFTVKHPVAAPEVKGVVDEFGCFSLQWQPVEGATEYRVYRYTDVSIQNTGVCNEAVNAAESGYTQGSLVYVDTVDADTTTFANFAGKNGNIVSMNRNFNNDEYVISQNPCVYGEFYVSAVVDGKESGFACAVSTSDLKIPYKPAEESDILFKSFSDASELPKTISVINIDGSISERNVMYEYKEVETYIEGLYAPEYYYTIEGTALKGYVSMDIEKEEAELPENIGESSTIGTTEPEDDITAQPDADIENVPEDADDDGSVIDDQIDQTQEDIEDAKEQEVEAPANNMMVFANSAAEEWLAINMINGENEISVEAFPELQTKEGLVDAIEKVIYQNPYVLGLCRYGYNYDTKMLALEYSYSDEERESRQKEVYEKANEIIEEVIEDDMTNEEKQMALYLYLEDNTEYDYDIVEKAEANNWKAMTDAESADSFSVYGIMVKGVGVCQSYAYTYKLLCTMAGLECDVVTGDLSGNLPHAWNTVKIDDAWYQVDVTNNKNVAGIPYLLYNAGINTAIDAGYTEDKMYEIDTTLAEYYNESDKLEYYNANNLYAETIEEYAEILSKEIEKGNTSVVIRYKGELPNIEDVAKAIQEVYYMANMESKLDTTKLIMSINFIVTMENK